MSTKKYMSYNNLSLYDENIKKYINDNFAKQDEPIFTGDIIVDGEVKATNVPHTISETILLTIPASTIQEALDSGTKDLTFDTFVHNPDVIVYANYGGYEYASYTNQSNYIEFFIADPYVTDGFACSFTVGEDADGNADETKCHFNYRLLDSSNVTDLIISQLEVSYIDSKYFDHDLTIINSISMNRRGAIGTYSTALGGSCKSTGNSSFASGLACEATGDFSTAVGKGTFATGEAGFATGLMTTAGREAIASGRQSKATGRGSFATGNNTTASGQYSTAEGQGSIAKNSGAHAEGNYTIAGSQYQHVEGKYNIEDTADEYANIIGNGDADANRSNAHTVDWEGNAWYSGDVYVGSTSGTNKDEGSKKLATESYVEALYTKLNSNTTLGFYCIEDVTIITNGISKVYPANSNVEIKFIEGDTFEIVTTSDNSILSLNAFPSALGVYYPWLEGVKQFSNILFDMNAEDMYTKWNQGNQGVYQVQYAQYSNCVFWSDNPYINDVALRTNYTLYNSAQLPLCYSNIPDNTFKAFYLALGVVNDPNWSNPTYKESFAKATWATQVFSYYGSRIVGTPEHFSIVLPKDCRGLMFYARNVEAAGTFDATNVTNFGAKSGSWREAFGYCSSLKRLYIENLKVNLNISWSPVDYDSIYYIISEATNTNAITISVSPYTYNLLSESDIELATSKNITIELITTNYVEDKRLSAIANKADKEYVDGKITELVNAAPETLDTLGELATAFTENKEVVDALNEAITNKADTAVVPTNLNNGSSEGSLRGINTLAEDDSYTMGENAFAIGNGTKASGKNSFASGQGVEATGSYAHAEGYSTFATAAAAHAEGYDTHATARYAHAEGASTVASGNNSHAEGNNTTSSGHYSHAEGNFTTAAGGYSHAEGNYAETGENGTYAHAEGSYTKATKTGAHAEGNHAEANGIFAHVEGHYTLANGMYQHVRGKYNIADDNDIYNTIIGNGDSESTRRNIHTLDWDGNAWFAGNVYIGSTSGVNKDEGSQRLATTADIESAMSEIVSITSEEIASLFN